MVFDEIHHAGDSLSWGEAVREAFEPAKRRLAMTGTPFRSDTNPIPFVTYERGADGSRRSSSDYVYGYGPALGDGVVRPVIFLAYSGQMRWQTRAGDELAGDARRADDRRAAGAGLADRADPHGEWIMRVLEAADRRLTEVRKGMPDAAAWSSPAITRTPAPTRRCSATHRRRGRSSCCPTTRRPARRSPRSPTSTDRWMVAVRMVSEGVDIPRLAVGVYATSVGTALFFAQAVGRFVRARRRGETASVFLPSIPSLLGYAAELEAERDHVLSRPDERRTRSARLPRRSSSETRRRADEGRSRRWRPRLISTGCFMTAVSSASPPRRRNSSACPACWSRTRSRCCCGAEGRPGQRPHPPSRGRSSRRPAVAARPEPTTRETLTALRKELNGLVAAWHHRTGQPHGTIHAELRRSCGGPAAAAGDRRADPRPDRDDGTGWQDPDADPDQSPVNTGARFAANAAMPSATSAEPVRSSWIRASSSS